MDITQPQEWGEIREVSEIDIILSTLVVASRADNARKYDELSDEPLEFKADPIRVEIASMISVFDPEVFFNLLNDQFALSRVSGAVGSTTANP